MKAINERTRKPGTDAAPLLDRIDRAILKT
ncbi:Lrp/AsnC family transcriptional regulator, partial [Pseudomonas syringae]|nr:Lrp/AsnC family transcriptional regulator [Pseudomonas syringae]